MDNLKEIFATMHFDKDAFEVTKIAHVDMADIIVNGPTNEQANTSGVAGGDLKATEGAVLSISKDAAIFTVTFKVKSDASEGEKEFTVSTYEITDNSDEKVTPEYDESGLKVTVKAADTPAQAQVTGTAVSWDDQDNLNISVYSADHEDADIRTAMWADAPAITPVTATVEKGEVKANQDGVRYDQTFSISGLTAGDYKIAIAKPGKYVVKVIKVTVGDKAVELSGEQKLWLYGDVTYDGQVDSADMLQISMALVNGSPLLDEELENAEARLDEDPDAVERFLTVDLDSNDSLNILDMSQVQTYILNKDGRIAAQK